MISRRKVGKLGTLEGLPVISRRKVGKLGPVRGTAGDKPEEGG